MVVNCTAQCIIVQCIPAPYCLQVFEQEAVPTLPLVVERIYDMVEDLKAYCEEDSTGDMAREFGEELVKQLEERFPEYGTNREESCEGNYLNPHLKGIHLKNLNKFEETKNAMEEKLKEWKKEETEDEG